MATQTQEFLGTGRRKTAVARVRLSAGAGKITVNGRAFEVYFPTDSLRGVVNGPMLRTDTTNPIKVFAHIAPYHGGPGQITSTNGAGDAALAALLHDMSANLYHRARVPTSSKHVRRFLTYSSMSQVCRYANRVSYEVLVQAAPRLTRALPEREEGLNEEAYWAM